MSESALVVIVLAAGQGTRMRSALPKVLHRVAGLPMINHVVRAAESLGPRRIVVVTGADGTGVAEAARPHRSVVQPEQLGTAHAVACARPAVEADVEAGAKVLVLYADGPLITADTLRAMETAATGTEAAPFVWLGCRPDDPTGYGRLLLDARDQRVIRIVEEKDATAEERAVTLCWGGLLLADGRALFDLLPRIGNDNAKGEYYLTSLAELAAADGWTGRVVETDAVEVRGVNSRSELAAAEALMQARLREAAMAGGATLVAPESVWLSYDTVLAPDVVVHPNVVFGPGVQVDSGAEILSFSHLEGASVGPGVRVGPFARLRPGTRLDTGARVGNFVEVKASHLGAGAKANHLTYLGDTDVGAEANVGAGTITCNYDGFAKHRTVIGSGAFIGSNTALVAPVRVGRDAVVGAGSTITEDVPDEALATARGPQQTRSAGAVRYRARRRGARKATAGE